MNHFDAIIIGTGQAGPPLVQCIFTRRLRNICQPFWENWNLSRRRGFRRKTGSTRQTSSTARLDQRPEIGAR
jgi:hypothetical protein